MHYSHGVQVCKTHEDMDFCPFYSVLYLQVSRTAPSTGRIVNKYLLNRWIFSYLFFTSSENWMKKLVILVLKGKQSIYICINIEKYSFKFDVLNNFATVLIIWVTLFKGIPFSASGECEYWTQASTVMTYPASPLPSLLWGDMLDVGRVGPTMLQQEVLQDAAPANQIIPWLVQGWTMTDTRPFQSS